MEKTATGPLTIYVAWHPECRDGRHLAKGIYDWFRKPSMAVERSGAGVPVYFRSRSRKWSPSLEEPFGDPTSSGDRNSLQPIHFWHAEINVVIPLVDELMVNDPRWRAWLYELGGLHRQSLPKARRDGLESQTIRHGQVLMVPVELHYSLARLDPIVSGINAVRVDRWDDTAKDQELEAAAETRGQEWDPDADRRRRRIRRARRYLVQTMVRELKQRRLAGTADLLPRSVFLSHAKGDRELGVGVAEAIRAEALNQGQVDTFLDSAQLDWGRPWQDPMETAAGERTAAFIAVFGDIYASRFWCRKEIRRARNPRPVIEQPAPDGAGVKVLHRIWWVQPTVIVDTLGSQWTRLLPEMSGAPIIRWQESPEAVGEILDRVMLEALRSEIQARHAALLLRDLMRQIAEGKDLPPLLVGKELHFITWSPDPHTLMEWARLMARDPKSEDAGSGEEHLSRETLLKTPKILVYPGHGLAQSDELHLQRYWDKGIELISVEELALEVFERYEAVKPNTDDFPIVPDDPADRPLVALSVSDPDLDELHALGYGPYHLDDAVYRIATALIGAGARLAYGGAQLRTENPEFLESLLDAAGMAGAGIRASGKQGPDPNPETFLHSFQAWGYYQNTTAETRARFHGLCTFHDVDADFLVDSPVLKDPQKALQWRARSLATLRRRMAEHCRALISLGGKRYGWRGLAPGILEEICRAHEKGRPVLVLSSFGGAAKSFAKWVIEEEGSFPLLTLDHHQSESANENFHRVRAALMDELDSESASDLLEKHYAELHRLAVDLRRVLRQAMADKDAVSYAGLTGRQLKMLMTTTSVSLVRDLLNHCVVPELLHEGSA